MLLRPDPTFYPSPSAAEQAPPESYCYITTLGRSTIFGDEGKPDSLTVVDLDSHSNNYGTIVGQAHMPNDGDEVHHFGWNACSSSLCPNTPHPHIERRYLLVPGIRSNQIHIFDVKGHQQKPKLIHTITNEEIVRKTGYTAPHTIHCGPTGVYASALGSDGGDGPGGIFVIDHQNFNVLGRWEVDRGPQFLSYDFWWNLAYDVMITSEWGTPNMFFDGLNPELLLKGAYGHQLHVWDLPKRRHVKALELGKEQQMILEVRPAHDPSKRYGFACAAISIKDLSAAVFLWFYENNDWHVKKVIEIPAQPADPADLPPLLKAFKAVPPLLTAIELSIDDKFLYASCWGTGELHQYDVSDPHNPKLVTVVEIGGIVKRTPHPKHPDVPLNGGPQMACISLDGKRVYSTNSLYSTWDDQFYPDGLKGWMVKFNVPEGGGAIEYDKEFFVDFKEERPHHMRLDGGDASSDSYCYS